MTITSVTGLPEDAFEQAQERFRIAAQEPDEDFETVLQSAMGMVDETNDLNNQAKSAMMQFALGESENTHCAEQGKYRATIYSRGKRQGVGSLSRNYANAGIKQFSYVGLLWHAI